jgi:hypothetical protein
MAGAYAAKDPATSLDWIAPYRGEPFYEDAHSIVAMQLADSSPELAATMIGSWTPALQSAAAPRIARAWAARNPADAAAWVSRLQGAAAEPGAASAVVSQWVRTDAAAARVWTLNLARGPMRNSAVYAYVSGNQLRDFDPRPLLQEIDAPGLRRSATQTTASRISQSNMALATAIVESAVDDPDPELSEWARSALETLRASGN